MSHQITKFTRVPGHEVFSQRYAGNSSRQNISNIWMTLKYKKYASYMIFLRIFPNIWDIRNIWGAGHLFMAYSDFPDNIAVTKLKTKWCNTKHITKNTKSNGRFFWNFNDVCKTIRKLRMQCCYVWNKTVVVKVTKRRKIDSHKRKQNVKCSAKNNIIYEYVLQMFTKTSHCLLSCMYLSNSWP